MPTTEELVYDALFSRVKSQPTGLPVVYANMPYPATRDAEKDEQYIIFSHVPNRPERVGIDGAESGSHVHRGLLSFALMTRLGVGNADSLALAGLIASHFPADLRLSSGSVVLRVVQTPNVTAGYRDGDRWRTPVVVEYETLTT